MSSLAELLAPEAARRRRQLEQLAAEALGEAATRFALRRVLAADGDATVRAAAAAALGRAARACPVSGQLEAEGPVRWLGGALRDVSPMVREAAVRALALWRAQPAAQALAERSRDDEIWWVRRAAVYALGVLGGELALAAVRGAVADPFWRVRHAAVQVLAVHGRRDPEQRTQLLADVPDDSAAYLRALWGPALVEGAPAPLPPSRLPAELLDRDPAVVTARLGLLGPEQLDAVALVELLSDPHQALRELAAARVAASGDARAWAAALRWLEEPRLPHVAATVTELLDGLGEPARALAAEVLAGAEPGAPRALRAGAARWAIGYAVATRDQELAPAAVRCAAATGQWLEALPLLDAETLGRLLDEPNRELALAAATELVRRPAEVRAALLAARSPHGDAEVAARLAQAAPALDSPHLRAAVVAVEPLPRAVALARLAAAEALAPEQLTRALGDEDPMVREAVLVAAPAARLASHLPGERDPWVRRALARRLAAVSSLGAAELSLLAADPDEWLRALAVSLGAAPLAALARDPSPMVQAALVERLAAASDAELETLLGAPSPTLAAWRAAAELAPAPAEAPAAARPRRAPQPVAEVPRVRLGTSGVRTARLVVSGAFELRPGSYRVALEAGVDTFFWEPTYGGLTRFLRAQPGAQVVTGTYHAEAAALRADVHSALRRLRRDSLEVFLLFWARSPARLDAEAFEELARLRRDGKVRAIGFSTHDRALAGAALASQPWDVVMTRHSAAHPGIEDELLPQAHARGVGVLTFSALCYGRMVAGPGAPSAADCYRYSLAQPGVSACLSAPRRHRELLENLEVVARPELPSEAVAALRQHGAGVRIENQRFGELIRRPTRDAAAAAMAMLENELAPEKEGRAPAGPRVPPAHAARLRRGRW